MRQTTIGSVYDEWIKMKRRMVRNSTVATYSTIAEKHILPALGSMHTIDDAGMQAFIETMTEEGLSPKMVKDVVAVLRMVMAYGKKRGFTEWHDWDVRMPPSNGTGDVRVLTYTQQRALMKHLRLNFSLRGLGIYMCLCTGMRIGEICALKWSDIDMHSRLISINHTIERIYDRNNWPKRTKVVINTPKTASSRREIPMSPDLASMLRPMMALANADNYVLSNTVKPVEPRVFRHYYQQLMERLGLPPMKFHGLRHTFATRCIESRCDYKTLSAILGHANINTTLNLYVHPDMSQKRRCINKMMRTVMREEK